MACGGGQRRTCTVPGYPWSPSTDVKEKTTPTSPFARSYVSARHNLWRRIPHEAHGRRLHIETASWRTLSNPTKPPCSAFSPLLTSNTTSCRTEPVTVRVSEARPRRNGYVGQRRRHSHSRTLSSRRNLPFAMRLHTRPTAPASGRSVPATAHTHTHRWWSRSTETCPRTHRTSLHS